MSTRRRRPIPKSLDVVYARDGKWWTAEAPALRGAYSQGRTRASARRNLLTAIYDLLDTYARLGEEPPISREVRVEKLPLAG
jgi:predicted RNase H-like HicB family nuclease